MPVVFTQNDFYTVCLAVLKRVGQRPLHKPIHRCVDDGSVRVRGVGQHNVDLDVGRLAERMRDAQHVFDTEVPRTVKGA